MARVLVVDDDAVTCCLLSEVLGRDGTAVVWETDPTRAVARLAEAPVALAIVDVRMPQMDGLDLLRQLRANAPGLPVIMMTAFGSIETAVDAIGAGAVDYISKPMDVEEIRRTVSKVLQRTTEQAAARPVGSDAVVGMVGRTPRMIEVYKTIARVAAGQSTVLILGESGTGKELVARAVHEHGPRREKPFVVVDCGALPEALLESELFGHLRGSFTGALRDTPGLFVEAHGGTLLLDEIGDITPAMQSKLLRVLQEHQVRPVGGTQMRAIDVRILAATNRDLAAAVAAGRFREDLYYRLKVVTIELPPLRERREDIPLLVEHLVRQAADHADKVIVGVSEEALTRLAAYHWPGNVRELSHVLERAVALSQHDVIGIADVPAEVLSSGCSTEDDADDDILEGDPTLAELRKRYIRRVLEEQGGNVTRAAAVLGVDRRSLYRMLHRYGLAPRGAVEG